MHSRFFSLLLCLAAGLPFRAALAQATAPSQGGEVNIVRATATTMELTFGTSGTGQGRLVAIAASDGGMPVPLAATNDTFYNADATYGQGAAVGAGYVVYNGTGYSADAEYNTDGSSIAYNTYGISISTATRSAPPAPLPVELTTFAGTVDARGTALLHWATATERNSAYFALERSADGTAFAEADRVAAAGTSSQPKAYQWPDPQRLAQPTYYRLRQADRDGAVHYSAVVALAPTPRVARQLEVYPNPSAGRDVQLLLRGFDGEMLTLRLTDALGRPVLAQRLAPAEAQYLAPLALPRGLAPGTYLLSLSGSGSPIQKRIIVSD